MNILNILILGNKFDFKKEDTNLRFVGDNFILTKGGYNVTIYYKNGNIEKTSVRDAGGVYIIKIKNDDYYMDKFIYSK